MDKLLPQGKSAFGDALLRCENLHLVSNRIEATGAHAMFYVAGALAIAAGVFYSAGLHELGQSAADLCLYGSTLCDKPHPLLIAAGLATAWGAFVSVR